MNTREAKNIIKQELNRRNLPYERLSARTVDFTDLLRERIIFVTIHGWVPNPQGHELEKIARDNGFRIQVRR